MSMPDPAPPEPGRDDRAPRRKPSDAAIGGRVAAVALLVMFALTALVIWIGG